MVDHHAFGDTYTRFGRRVPMSASTAIWVSAAVVILLAGFMVGRRWADGRRSRRRRRAAAHGRAMEERAPAALARRGYRVIERHPRHTIEWWVDGEPRELTLEPDLRVARGGRELLVEVKTGGAARVEQRDTRRQLLEYAAYCDCDGILLYDADADTLREVVFPLPEPPPMVARIALAWALGVMVGAGAILWWSGH